MVYGIADRTKNVTQIRRNPLDVVFDLSLYIRQSCFTWNFVDRPDTLPDKLTDNLFLARQMIDPALWFFLRAMGPEGTFVGGVTMLIGLDHRWFRIQHHRPHSS